jgi:uncharacterized ParB-like nuclease family protein
VSTLQVSAIRLDFQPAENLNEETVLTYMGLIARSEPIAPITVRSDGQSYFLQDGFHRLEAVKRCGIASVEAEIVPGTRAQMEAEFREYVEALRRNLAE